jgi:hypothetical protein
VNAIVVIIVLAALVSLVTPRLRSRQAGRCQSHIRPRALRFLNRRDRQAGVLQARELARAITEDRPDPIAHLAAGVVLQPGEEPWLQIPARLAVRTSQAAWRAHTQRSWLGRRARNVTRETITERWQDHGDIDWLITSQRIVGRLPASTEMISVWWVGVAGVDIDLKSERIVLNGVNGWTGVLSGSTVTPIAVASVAMCHGVESLLVHPALHGFWQRDPKQPPRAQDPEAIGSGGSIVSLPARRTTR